MDGTTVRYNFEVLNLLESSKLVCFPESSNVRVVVTRESDPLELGLQGGAEGIAVSESILLIRGVGWMMRELRWYLASNKKGF